MGETANIGDLELAKSCARGDDKARKELYTRYAGSLYGLCIRYVGDRELARDLMHDSIIKVFDTIGKYRPTGTLKSWVCRVTVNHVIDYLRKSRRFETERLDDRQEKIPAPVQEQLRIVPTPVEAEDYDLVAESKEGEISVVRDTAVAPTEVFVAENLYEGAEENVEREAPELRERRKRVTISLGAYATGGIAGGTILPMAKDMAPTLDPPQADNPVDTSGFYTPETVPMSRRGRKVKSSSETHHLPVSYGVSARFKLTRRFSINTGLDYTLYNSSFKTEYTDGSTVTEKQSAHYLGIPVRFDWMLVDRPHFGMYMGIGGQINKCIYAKRGEKRLHEYNMLYSLGATVGVQYNVNSRFSLYLEPDLGFNLNEGDINTYRNGGEFMFTARAGLRINL